MKDTNTQPGIQNEIQPKPGMGPIDVASQHVKGSLEWLLELLGKGDEISPEMKEILANQAQQLLAVLSIEEEIAENFLLTEAELSEIKAYIESDIKNTWKGRDKTVKTESGEVETPLDFYKRVYAKWIPRLTKGQLRHIDGKLYEAFDNWSRRTKSIIPSEILPKSYGNTKHEVITDEDMKIYSKVCAMYNRRAREKRLTK